MSIPRSVLSAKPIAFPTVFSQNQSLVFHRFYFTFRKSFLELLCNRILKLKLNKKNDFLHSSVRPTKKKDGYEATAQTPNQAKTANYAHQHDDDEEESDEDPFATNGDSSDDFADPGSASDSDDAFDADTDEDDNE